MKTATIRLGTVLVLGLLGACGGTAGTGAAVATVVKPPPEPPRDPLAWLPADASLVVHLDLTAWRASPLSGHFSGFQDVAVSWIDLDRAAHAYAGILPHGDGDVSAVAVLQGDFGEGYLAARAAELGLSGQPHGELTVYQNDETQWFQIWPDTLVGCSADRLEPALARVHEGPEVALRASPLFTELAPVVDFDQAHAALLLQDADGSQRRALGEAGGAQGARIEQALSHVARGAVRVRFADGLGLTAVGDADTEEHAQQLSELLQAYLDRWIGNPLVMLFGLRDILGTLQVGAAGDRVTLSAQVSQQQIDELMERLSPMLENLMERRAPEPASPAPATVEPAAQTPSESRSVAP